MNLVRGIIRIIERILRALVVSVAIIIAIACCAILLMWPGMNWFQLWQYRQQIRQWDVPATSQLQQIDLELWFPPAGNNCLVDVTLILQSSLDADDIRDFYITSPDSDLNRDGAVQFPPVYVEAGTKPDEWIVRGMSTTVFPYCP